MNRLQRVLGWTWASPLTLCGLLYAGALSVLGWYRWEGAFGDGLVWSPVHEQMPKWLARAWRHWSGQAVGNVIVVNSDVRSHRGQVVLRHEQEHVRQAMVFGPFLPVYYGLAYLGLCLCAHAHPFYDHPLEVDARRAAGQVVDVIEALKRAVAEGKIRLPKKAG